MLPADLQLSPEVRFAPDFAARVGRLVARLAGGVDRREGRGGATLFGAGEEFVGFRPYRPGEDLRRLDWNLLARLDQPLVRVSRREASEHWAVLLDTSASMAVGEPGKLSLAAEVAAGVTAAGLRAGARVTLRSSADAAELVVERRGDLARVLGWLEARRARGRRDVSDLFEGARRARWGRVFVLGDLFGRDPADTAALLRRGRELSLLRVVAREEWRPEPDTAVEWVDPETGERERLRVDARLLAAYVAEFDADLSRWREFAARHRVPFGCWTSDVPFEAVAGWALGGA